MAFESVSQCLNVVVSYFTAPISIKYRFHSLETIYRILIVVAVLMSVVEAAAFMCLCGKSTACRPHILSFRLFMYSLNEYNL